ncbi:MAG: alanine racemase [Actinobacteria bacterium]|nr:alanine racemase [Actinomycetota bacterium]
MQPRTTFDLSTPALLIDLDVLNKNLRTMSLHHPGTRLRPHTKAHKCTSLAQLQLHYGHKTFTCATPREVIGMAAAGVGEDLLLANEVLNHDRLSALARVARTTRVTIAVDSQNTIDAAARAGLEDVLVDVNVGLPRCGVAPDDAGRLAESARRAGLTVRGVMGYEGHLMMVDGRDKRRQLVAESMRLLAVAARNVGGEIVSAGGTGTFDLHDDTGINELQAGSYALMDTHYARLGLPFEQGCFVLGTVISIGEKWLVVDVGLKALGMDHGNPSVAGFDVLFCSDEHTTLAPGKDSTATKTSVGDKLRVVPAHIDPTMAMHDNAWLVRGEEVIDCWSIDLRGW